MEDNFLSLDGHDFKLICHIKPQVDEDGLIKKIMPQGRYKKAETTPLNPYGSGPFCKFTIPRKMNWMGVYIIDVSGLPNYVGECKDFSSRFNSGYGNISPKNCYIGGQRTNCRINNKIYHASVLGEDIRLWFLRTENYKVIEASLRASQKMRWNLI